MRPPAQVAPADFSAEAIRAQTRKLAVEHPAVLYPGVVGILGLASSLVIDSTFLAYGIGLLGVVASGAVWALNLGLRREHLAGQYVRRMAKEMEQRRELRVREIHDALINLDSEEGQSQFVRLNEKFAAFRDLLDRKLDASELAHAKYLGIAEQVYLAALDNLNTVANTLRGLAVIDADHARRRLGQRAYEEGAPSAQERAALQQRLDLWTSQTAKVRDLLAENETAMTELDRTLAVVAEMRSGDHQASVDLDTAMAELGRIAGRAKELPR